MIWRAISPATSFRQQIGWGWTLHTSVIMVPSGLEGTPPMEREKATAQELADMIRASLGNHVLMIDVQPDPCRNFCATVGDATATGWEQLKLDRIVEGLRRNFTLKEG